MTMSRRRELGAGEECECICNYEKNPGLKTDDGVVGEGYFEFGAFSDGTDTFTDLEPDSVLKVDELKMVSEEDECRDTSEAVEDEAEGGSFEYEQY